jgi:hypothetical protein
MDQRIESFLADVLALAGEDPNALREGVRIANRVIRVAAAVLSHRGHPLSF